MKRLFLSLFLFCAITSSSIAATPPPKFDGTFSFGQDSQAIQGKRYEVVYSFTQEGRKRLQELYTKNYACENKGREIYLCSKFFRLEENPESLAKAETRQEEKLAGTKVIFFEREGSPKLLVESEILEEWEIQQPVEVLGKKFSKFRFLRSQGMQKLFFGEVAEESFLYDGSRLLHYATQSVTLNKEQRDVYLVQSPFQN